MSTHSNNCKLFLVIIMSLFIGCSPMKVINPTSKNCDLTSPPGESGEEGGHGGLLIIFPRKSSINPTYWGCQTVWIQRSSETFAVKFAVGMFEAGKLVAIKYRTDGEVPQQECTLKDGEILRADSDFCDVIKDQFPFTSQPPGCFSKTPSMDPQRREYCDYD